MVGGSCGGARGDLPAVIEEVGGQEVDYAELDRLLEREDEEHTVTFRNGVDCLIPGVRWAGIWIRLWTRSSGLSCGHGWRSVQVIEIL